MPSFAAARAVEMALGRREEVPVGAKSERFGIWNLQGRKMNKTRQKKASICPHDSRSSNFQVSLLTLQTLGNDL